MSTIVTSTLEQKLDSVLSLLRGVKRYSRGHLALCPHHGDKEPSLMIWTEGDDQAGNVALKCFAGCTRKDIVESIGLSESDLYTNQDKKGARTPRQETLDLAALGIDKCILPNLLAQQWGIVDGECTYHPEGKQPYIKKGVVIPYYDMQGNPYARYRLRIALEGKRFLWNEGDPDPNKHMPIIPYGLHKLEEARAAGYLVLTEGESDVWTLGIYHIPALGIPGIEMVASLAKEHLEGILKLYIIQEPPGEQDIEAGRDPGKKFVENITKRLKDIGYTGRSYSIDFKAATGAKDPNDLHKHLAEQHKHLHAFKPAFEAALLQAKQTTPLPQISLSGQLRERWDVCLDALRKAEQKHPTIFVQSARLVQIGQDDKKHPIIMQLGIAELKNALSRSADYYRIKEKGDEDILIPISPPKEIAESILALNPGEWRFPSLEAIIETPVIRPDGSILDTPGYDQATRLYYYPQEGMKACKVPCNPTKADIAAALTTIDEAIGEFPYVEQADRANAYGCLLTPFIRPAIRHAPLALVDAPKQGTGKGLYSDVVSTTATGASAAILTLSDNDEELQKNITALLIEGVTIITIDNLAGKLQSKHLDGVLTADTWRGRILGQSKMVKVPQRATWIATGNNIILGGDLARRCYRIRLDPHVSRPWMRKGFKHEDLLAWVSEHRSELIAALLTLARAWFVAGKPQYDNIPMLGTFTSWAKTVGGILAYCGVQGFLTNLEQLYEEADEDSAQWEAFLIAWRDAFGEAWKTTAEIVKELKPAADSAENSADSALVLALPDTLQVSLKEKPNSFSIVFGKALERRLEACFGDNNLRIERDVNKSTKAKKWRVVGDFADSADSSTRHTQDKNGIENSAYKNDIEYDAIDYPHYPQTSNSDIAQNGATGQSNPLSGTDESEKALSANDPLSAKKKRDPFPRWLIPGTPEWEKEVQRSGLADVQARRAAALKEREAQA